MEVSPSDSTDTHPTHSNGRGCSETEFLEDLSFFSPSAWSGATQCALCLSCPRPPLWFEARVIWKTYFRTM